MATGAKSPTEARNIELVQRVVDEIWKKKNVQHAAEFFASEHTYHDPSHPSSKGGHEGYREFAANFHKSFPDLTPKVEDIFASADRVVLRWSAQGTHQDHLQGIAPSNKKAKLQGVSIFRISGDKIAQTWNVMDTLGMLQQLDHVSKVGAYDATK